MKQGWAVASALLFGVAVLTQGGCGPGSVSGRILCDDTREPARKANVFLLARFDPKLQPAPPRDAFWATSDAGGSFAIPNVTPGSYYVIAKYAGYISAEEYIFLGPLSPEMGGSVAIQPFVQLVEVNTGQSRHVEIRLKRGGAISGFVRYSDGSPVADAALTPQVRLRNGEFADSQGSGASHSDSSGRYRIEGLPDSSYAILCGIEGGMVPVFDGSRAGVSGVMVFAGGGMRPTKARVIGVAGPKENTEIDITIPLTGVHDVGGGVTVSDGHRPNSGLVRLYPTGEPRYFLSTHLLADGTFQFHQVPADNYTLSVEKASDWKMVPTINGTLHYGQPTLVRSYGPASVDIHVAGTDVTNVSLSVSASK